MFDVWRTKSPSNMFSISKSTRELFCRRRKSCRYRCELLLALLRHWYCQALIFNSFLASFFKFYLFSPHHNFKALNMFFLYLSLGSKQNRRINRKITTLSVNAYPFKYTPSSLAPYPTYGLTVWDQACKSYLDKLLKLQKRALCYCRSILRYI